jgi:hypothetical protein
MTSDVDLEMNSLLVPFVALIYTISASIKMRIFAK